MFGLFTRKSRLKRVAHQLFVDTVDQARDEFFYKDLHVADTLDGRFDMILLHITLVGMRLDRIGTKDATLLRRLLQEVMFDNMDLSLREMGVGDLSVGKKIKAMAEAFYGRMMAYQAAFNDKDVAQKLEDVIVRNVYRNLEMSNEVKVASAELAQYVLKARAFLNDQEGDKFISGDIKFLNVN